MNCILVKGVQYEASVSESLKTNKHITFLALDMLNCEQKLSLIREAKTL
jgi:hypothetical protein